MPRKYSLGKRAASVEETRRRIVEATVALHGEKGILATTYEDIARRADVSVGTVYRHFPEIEQAVMACGQRVIEIIQPPTPAIFAGVDPEERLVTLVRETFRCYERGPHWMQALERDKEHLSALEGMYLMGEQMRETLIRQALGEGAPEASVRLAMALTSFSAWKALEEQGIEDKVAVTVSLLTPRLDGPGGGSDGTRPALSKELEK